MIVAPGYVPPLTLASSTPAISVTASSTANQFIVKTMTPQAGSFTLVSSGRQNTVTQSVNVSESAAIYVPSLESGAMEVFDQNGTPIATTGSFPGLSKASSLAFDPANGYLYVTQYSGGGVSVFDQNGNAVTKPGTFPSTNAPVDVALNPGNGRLFVANYGNSTITIYDVNGNLISTSNDSTLKNPVGIAYDSTNDTLYVANQGSETVTTYDESGTKTSTGSFPALTAPTGIAYDGARNELYVQDANTIDVFQPNGTQLTSSGGFPNQEDAFGVAFDPVNDDIYTTEYENGALLTYDQDGAPLASLASPSLSGAYYPLAVP